MEEFKEYDSIMLVARATTYLLLKSTWIEWSMTKSAGQIGLIFSGFPPSIFTASRMAAKSTTAGTPL